MSSIADYWRCKNLLNRAVSREMRAKGIAEEQALADLKVTKSEIVEEYYGHAVKSRRRKAA